MVIDNVTRRYVCCTLHDISKYPTGTRFVPVKSDYGYCVHCPHDNTLAFLNTWDATKANELWDVYYGGNPGQHPSVTGDVIKAREKVLSEKGGPFNLIAKYLNTKHYQDAKNAQWDADIKLLDDGRIDEGDRKAKEEKFNRIRTKVDAKESLTAYELMFYNIWRAKHGRAGKGDKPKGNQWRMWAVMNWPRLSDEYLRSSKVLGFYPWLTKQINREGETAGSPIEGVKLTNDAVRRGIHRTGLTAPK